MYTPPADILDKYADLLINFALNSGGGVKEKEVVNITLPDVAKPMYVSLQTATLKAGAIPKFHLYATDADKSFFAHANEYQLSFFPKEYKRAEADLIDHSVSILGETDPKELQDVDPEKLFRAMDARREYREWLHDKENQGKFTWTLALYGTEAMAKEANMTPEEYWAQIIHACYLDTDDPKVEWRRIQTEQERLKKVLTDMAIEKVHVTGKNIDLWVKFGEKRQWLGGSGRNIPSYELFISPDWRGTQGHIFFNQPLYRYGNILKNVRLEFKDGRVTKATADQGQNVLESMIKRENADKIGEYSLTDSRFSRITKFMANTLFDENIGGEFGNMHIAVGKAYKESYTGDVATATKDDWEKLGFNESPEHTDIITTEDRTVTAVLPSGEEKIIFEKGQFTV